MADTQLKGAQGSLFVMPPHGTHEGVSLKPLGGIHSTVCFTVPWHGGRRMTIAIVGSWPEAWSVPGWSACCGIFSRRWDRPAPGAHVVVSQGYPHESQVSLGPCHLTAGARVAGPATMKVLCVHATRHFVQAASISSRWRRLRESLAWSDMALRPRIKACGIARLFIPF